MLVQRPRAAIMDLTESWRHDSGHQQRYWRHGPPWLPRQRRPRPVVHAGWAAERETIRRRRRGNGAAVEAIFNVNFDTRGDVRRRGEVTRVERAVGSKIVKRARFFPVGVILINQSAACKRPRDGNFIKLHIFGLVSG